MNNIRYAQAAATGAMVAGWLSEVAFHPMRCSSLPYRRSATAGTDTGGILCFSPAHLANL